jgi:hypothetical protein
MLVYQRVPSGRLICIAIEHHHFYSWNRACRSVFLIIYWDSRSYQKLPNHMNPHDRLFCSYLSFLLIIVLHSSLFIKLLRCLAQDLGLSIPANSRPPKAHRCGAERYAALNQQQVPWGTRELSAPKSSRGPVKLIRWWYGSRHWGSNRARIVECEHNNVSWYTDIRGRYIWLVVSNFKCSMFWRWSHWTCLRRSKNPFARPTSAGSSGALRTQRTQRPQWFKNCHESKDAEKKSWTCPMPIFIRYILEYLYNL